MLNRYSSDKLNPIFYKIIHQVTTTKVIPIVFGLQLLLTFCFLYAYIFLDHKMEATTITALYTELWAIQLIYFLHLQLSDIQIEGLDPTRGTRLTAGQIITGQLSALAVIQAVTLLPLLPLTICSTFHNRPLCNTTTPITPITTFLWTFLLFYLLGILLLAGCNSIRRLQQRSATNMIVACCIILPFISGIYMAAFTFSRMSWPAQLIALLCCIPAFVLPITYLYGTYLPISMDRDTQLRKATLCLIPYALPVSYIAFIILPPVSATFPEFLQIIYAILIAILAAVYIISATVEPMLPCYKRISDARTSGHKALLSLLWQGGAIPGYITGLLYSLILLCLIPKEAFDAPPPIRLSWMFIPLISLIILARHFNIGNLPAWGLALTIFGFIIILCVIFASECIALLICFSKATPKFFIFLNYALGLLLAFPAIKKYYKVLLGKNNE